ncbi:MAG: hypothetical protein M1819_001108 [Sarea resinae]|nr:MAG: hypothetical protein M1819_001108 [Sarea resinae]
MKNIVGADVQLAYLGTPSKDALIKLASHMSFTRDPRAMLAVTAMTAKNIEQKVRDSSQAQDLIARRDDLRNSIIAEYRLLKNAQDTKLGNDYRDVRADLRTEKASIQRAQFQIN